MKTLILLQVWLILLQHLFYSIEYEATPLLPTYILQRNRMAKSALGLKICLNESFSAALAEWALLILDYDGNDVCKRWDLKSGLKKRRHDESEDKSVDLTYRFVRTWSRGRIRTQNESWLRSNTTMEGNSNIWRVGAGDNIWASSTWEMTEQKMLWRYTCVKRS